MTTERSQDWLDGFAAGVEKGLDAAAERERVLREALAEAENALNMIEGSPLLVDAHDIAHIARDALRAVLEPVAGGEAT